MVRESKRDVAAVEKMVREAMFPRQESKEIAAEWSGAYPALCRGSWTLTVNGDDYTWAIPKSIRKAPMNTKGLFDFPALTDAGDLCWESRESGLDESEWINENLWWLLNISEEIETQRKVYRAFHEEDWRHESCGGCL